MQFYGHMLLMISMVEKENYKKQINEDLGQKKLLKENKIKYMSNGKDMITHSIAALIQKDLIEGNSLESNSLECNSLE